MKKNYWLLLLLPFFSVAQRSENLIIITLDGFRWQEVFKGMDSIIANNASYHQGDSAFIFDNYWSGDETERRKKLLPFIWTTVAAKGQLYGNRAFGNKVDVANPYWFSYPGYSEIFTGYVDTAINSNSHPANPNKNVLELLNAQAKFKNKVAAFGAWETFNCILNEKRSGIPVFAAFDELGGKHPNGNEKFLNRLLKDSYKPWLKDECLDVFTHYGAMEYLKTRKPKVFFIGYGETDEWAHSGQYRSYLDAAHQADAWLMEIWNFVQSDPQYKNKTTIFITTDHGRGDINKDEWTSHNNNVQDSHEVWFALLGPAIKSRGEMKIAMQLYQQQLAQTFARLLGVKFKAPHPVAEEVKQIFE
ncbi:MAG: phosphoglyceromutase [Chitinophagaceae bacterium]